jgi:hypothetical protein
MGIQPKFLAERDLDPLPAADIVAIRALPGEHLIVNCSGFRLEVWQRF